MHTGGLANIGNTCSINTLIQCLAHCPKFSSINIAKAKHHKNEKYILYNELKEIFKLILIDKHSVTPKRFIKAFYESIGDTYTFGEELDFTEMWMLMLDIIIEETKLSEDKSPLSTIFYGSQIQQIRCITCNSIYHNKEPMSFYYIQVKDNTSIISSFEKMLSEEQIYGWKCDKCSHNSGIKSIHIKTLPKIWVIILQRCSTNTKINTPIDITDSIIISSHSKDFKITYKLKSIANHYGCLNSGHYTATCIDDEETWYEYDDLNIRRVEDIHKILLQNRNAYVLFYER